MIGTNSLCAMLFLSAISAAGSSRVPLVESSVTLEAGGVRTWSFNAPGRGTSVGIEIRSRMNASSMAGSTFFLKVMLNGEEVRPSKRRDVHRLQNRPLISPVAPSLSAPWYGEGGWRVVYGASFDTPKRESFYHGDPWTLVLDVTDMIRPEGVNQLQILNTAGSSGKIPAVSTGELVVGTLALRFEARGTPGDRHSSTSIEEARPPGDLSTFSVKVHAGGGFSINSGKRRFQFASSFSYPNSGWNRLMPGEETDHKGQPGWHCVMHQADQLNGVDAVGPDYQIRRRIRIERHKVEISDTITNSNADSPLGLMVRHEMNLEEMDKPVIRLAGNPDPALNDYFSPGNPSVHVATSHARNWVDLRG